MDQIIKFTKKYITVIIILLFYIVSLLSCDNNSIDLGGHFKYDVEHQYISGHQIGILYPYYTYHQPERKDVPPLVIDYEYDDVFILVKQIPQLPIEQIYYDYNDVTYPFGLDSTYYWIINKNNGIVLGPLTYTDFYNKCMMIGAKSTWNDTLAPCSKQ